MRTAGVISTTLGTVKRMKKTSRACGVPSFEKMMSRHLCVLLQF